MNRLKKAPAGRDVDAERLEQGLWLDVRRMLRGVLGRQEIQGEVLYKVKKAGRNGFVLISASSLLDVVVTAYEVGREDRSAV